MSSGFATSCANEGIAATIAMHVSRKQRSMARSRRMAPDVSAIMLPQRALDRGG